MAGEDRPCPRDVVCAAGSDLQQLTRSLETALGLCELSFTLFDDGFDEWCAPSSLRDVPARSSADEPLQGPYGTGVGSYGTREVSYGIGRFGSYGARGGSYGVKVGAYGISVGSCGSAHGLYGDNAGEEELGENAGCRDRHQAAHGRGRPQRVRGRVRHGEGFPGRPGRRLPLAAPSGC